MEKRGPFLEAPFSLNFVLCSFFPGTEAAEYALCGILELYSGTESNN
jgi:hypothetical protein